ncbi:T-complex protein 1 subunit theta-like [Oncorhynchus tshawytscha]|uniref:T-complex protein 1 subunit theta-like n=1 Tax=Oncorhynchus tshawytscha TaxID=74940 RepID=UPI001C3DA456|nr:T-complex protein 1 subunit theta-like [Oncorhynchus tshawytscha]
MIIDDHTPATDTPKIPKIPSWPGIPKQRPQEALHVEPIVALGQRLRPCYGPRGLVKSLLFRFPHGFSSSPVTSPDTLSVLTHMALEDPSALTLASAASTQAREHGDGAGMVLLLAASLLTQAKDLLTLGVTGAEIQGGYRQACGRALALLEGMACGALKDPREELDVRAILGPFLSSWQPGFEALLSGVVARCCVHSWRPITSGDRGEVWEGVTFDPSCVRVCTVLEKAIPDQGSETEDGQIETDGEELIQTKGEGEERTGVEEVQMMKEEGKETGKEMESERTAEASEVEEGENETNNNESLREEETEEEVENQVKRRICQKMEDAIKQMDDEETEDDEGKEENTSDDWVDLGLEIWRGSFAKLISHCSTQRQIYKHITSVRSAQRRRRLHRPKGHLTSPTTHHHHSRKKTRQSPRKTPTSIPLWASVVVEEPLDEEACCKVTVTVRSPDQALLISAEAALRASLRVYCSLLAEPRVVPGAGASEVGLAAGLTQNGLTLVGMEQLAVHAFAQALLEPVKALGENGGTPAELAVLRGYKRRWKGKMDGTKGAYRGVLDRLGCKASAIEKATKASLVVLTELLSQIATEEDKTKIFFPVTTEQAWLPSLPP